MPPTDSVEDEGLTVVKAILSYPPRPAGVPSALDFRTDVQGSQRKGAIQTKNAAGDVPCCVVSNPIL